MSDLYGFRVRLYWKNSSVLWTEYKNVSSLTWADDGMKLYSAPHETGYRFDPEGIDKMCIFEEAELYEVCRSDRWRT